jgi:hypothetical protein
MSLCKYKDIFGKPNTGLHVIRFFDIAIVDVLLLLLVGFVIHKYYNEVDLSSILLFLFILSIVAHRMFCVRTTIDKLLFDE